MHLMGAYHSTFCGGNAKTKSVIIISVTTIKLFCAMLAVMTVGISGWMEGDGRTDRLDRIL